MIMREVSDRIIGQKCGFKSGVWRQKEMIHCKEIRQTCVM